MVNAAGGMPPIPMTQPIGKFLKGATDESISDVTAEKLAEQIGTEESQRHETKDLQLNNRETGSTSYQHGFHQVVDIPTTIALF